MLSNFSARVCTSYAAIVQSSVRRLMTSENISYTITDDKNHDSNQVPVVLAHGALGNKKNFNTLAKRLSMELERSVITYDARNHGKSKHSEDMSLEAMSGDLEHLLGETGHEKCILIGHSLGGRTSMHFALHKPQYIEELIVVDIPLNFDMGKRNGLIMFLEAMKQVNWDDEGTLTKARMTADRQLKPHIRDETIRQFILTNIEKEADGAVKWRCNLDALLEHMKDVNTQVVTPQAKVPFDDRCLFLCGGNSTYVTNEDYHSIREVFPNAVFSHIPQCGHWVHFEKPNEFLQHIKDYLHPRKIPLFHASL